MNRNDGRGHFMLELVGGQLLTAWISFAAMRSLPSGSKSVFGLALLIAALLLLAGSAQAQPHRCGSRVISTVVGPKRLYFKATPGVSCQTAYRMIRTYFQRAKKGLCSGSGCVMHLRGWECHTAPGGVEVRYGTVTSCSNHRRWILTSRYPRRGFRPEG